MKNFPKNFEGVRSRLEAIILSETQEKGRFAWLEANTGIPRNTWQTFWSRQTSTPNGEMLQAIARLFPRYALWLVSGLTDGEFGHTFPKGSVFGKCYPESREYEDRKRFDEYFEHCKLMQMDHYGTECFSKNERENAFKRLEYLSSLRELELNTLREGKIERAKKIVKESNRDDSNQNL